MIDVIDVITDVAGWWLVGFAIVYGLAYASDRSIARMVAIYVRQVKQERLVGSAVKPRRVYIIAMIGLIVIWFIGTLGFLLI